MKYLLMFLFMMPAVAKTKIGIIDTGLNLLLLNNAERRLLCKKGHYDFEKNQRGVGMDLNGHGTFIFKTIASVLGRTKDVCVVIYKTDRNADLSDEVKKARIDNVRYLNLSMVTGINMNKVNNQVRGFLKRGYMYAAAGNSNQNLNHMCDVYPQCSIRHRRFHVVGAREHWNLKIAISNYGRIVTDWVLAKSTSEATAISLARAVKEYKNAN